MKLIKEKNEIVEGLRIGIEGRRRREGGLREQLAEAERRAEARRRVITVTDDTIADSVLGGNKSIPGTISVVIQASMDGVGWEAGPTDFIEGKVRKRARSELVLNCGESLPNLTLFNMLNSKNHYERMTSRGVVVCSKLLL